MAKAPITNSRLNHLARVAIDKILMRFLRTGYDKKSQVQPYASFQMYCAMFAEARLYSYCERKHCKVGIVGDLK
ncbi:hypothetical protein GCM10007921_01580 [Tritonibacter mobilis]|nr:hypothetical protein GCM10007921_01580 [Tritonibacter mobilis]